MSRINNSSTYQFEDSSGDIRNISSLQPVPFPAGTTGVRALHNTTYYKTAMGLTLQTQLYPTENVLSAIQNYDILNRDSAIYNIDTLWVFNQEGLG